MDSESSDRAKPPVSTADFFYRLIALAERAANVGAHDLAEELIELAYAAWEAAQRDDQSWPGGVRRKLMTAVVLTGIAACSAGLAITGHANLFHQGHLYHSLLARAHAGGRGMFASRRGIRAPELGGRRASYDATQLTFDPPLPRSLNEAAGPESLAIHAHPRTI